jgi:aspartate 4-decarboxylase
MKSIRKKKRSNKKTRKNNANRIKKISPSLFKKYVNMSPFELKNILIILAKEKGIKTMLNAGRGNPNFYNNFCRKIFAKLQSACLKIEGKKGYLHDLNVYPTSEEYNYETQLKKHTQSWPNREKTFFYSYMKYLKDIAKKEKLDENFIFHDIVLSTLGCFYPSPPRIQPHLEIVARRFLYDLVLTENTNQKSNNISMASKLKLKPNDFNVFATEGAAAGILYIFNSLKENFLLNPGDTIALITPIFSPYLEMPKLADYDLKIVELKCNPNTDYSLDDEEINKLKDKKIKALFMVNPANPAAFALPRSNIDKIGHIVNTVRKDLIVLSDNVYAPFTDNYNSFMLTCPLNTIEVYSLSKYFGTTGWRLGLTMIAKNNRFDFLLKNLSKEKKKKLNDRYKMASITPEKISFMERLVLDSRQVAEGHVGGLSTPQQTLIGLFLFYYLSDKDGVYKNEIHTLLKTRIEKLYAHVNTKPSITINSTNYYTLLDIPQITENLYGSKAREYLTSNYEYLEFLFHLAKKYQVVLLPGLGFGATKWRIRVSLANLETEKYSKISVALAKCIEDFVKQDKSIKLIKH